MLLRQLLRLPRLLILRRKQNPKPRQNPKPSVTVGMGIPIIAPRMNTHPVVALTVRLVPFAIAYGVLRWSLASGVPDGKAGAYGLVALLVTGGLAWLLTPMEDEI